MSKLTALIVIIIIALVFFGLGLMVGSSRLSPELSSLPNDYQAGWQAAKQRLKETGFLPAPPGQQEIKSISGQVTGVDKNIISISIRPLEPLADPALDTREVEVGKDTALYRLEPKSQDDYAKEWEAYQKAVAAGTGALQPPSPYEKKELGIADIAEGQRVSVTASSDIKEAKKFTALEVSLQSDAPLPVMPPIAAPAPASVPGGAALPPPAPIAPAPVPPPAP
jgi:hypothetical protein